MLGAKRVLLALFSTLALACEQEGRVSGSSVEPHSEVESQDLDRSLSSVRGLSRILFSTPLKGINSREHFVIEFEAIGEDSQLTLHSHFNGFPWMDGVDVHLKRRGPNLQVTFASPGFSERPLGVIEGVFASSPWTRLRLEVHDGGIDGVRILVWRDWIDNQRAVRRARDRVQPENSDLDSREANLIFLSHGRGARWGLTLQRVLLRAAFREGPYVQR